MRTLKIILLSLLALVVIAVIAVVIILKTFNINAYLPQITKAASDASGKTVTIDKIGLDLSLDGIAADVYKVRMADLGPDPKLVIMADKVHARIEVMPFLKKQQIQINGIAVSDIKVTMADPKAPITIDVPNMQANVPDLALNKAFNVTIDLTFAAVANNVHIETDVKIDPETKKVDLSNLTVQTDLAQLDMAKVKAITPMLAQVPLPTSVAGRAMLIVPHLSAGAKAPADIKAEGEFNIVDGRLEGFNLLKTVLGHVNVVPGLGDQIGNMVSDKFKNKLGGDNTTLDKVLIKFTVEDQQVFIDDAVIQSTNVFEVKAKGTAAFDGTVGVDMFMYVSPDISATLTESLPPLKGLVADDQRIYIPGRVAGKAPAIGYVPDMSYISKRVISSEGAQQLDKVLEKNPEIKNALNSVLGEGNASDMLKKIFK